MGMYINKTSNGRVGASFSEKCSALEADGAKKLPGAPKEWQENLVCVVDNGPFAAAAYCYDSGELRDFSYPGDYRPKQWYIYEHATIMVD